MEFCENSLTYILPAKDSIVRQIIDYILTLESFSLDDLKSKFLDCSTVTIRYALRLATANLMIYKYEGKYCRN